MRSKSLATKAREAKAAADPRAYRVDVNTALGLGTTGMVRGYVASVVRVSTDKTAWTSPMYTSKEAARLQGNRMRPRYEYHLQTHGEGHEEAIARERAAKRCEGQKRQNMRAHGPAMYRMLADIVAAPECERADMIEQARALLADIDAKGEANGKD